MELIKAVNSIDVTTNIQLFDDTTGAPKTDLTISDIDMIYIRARNDAVKADAVALSNDDDPHDDNHAKEIVDGTDYEIGVYRFDWPDAAFAEGVKYVTLIIKCSGVRTKVITVQLDEKISTMNVGSAINVVVAEDNTGGSIKETSFVGSQTNTYASTAELDGVYHKIDDTANEIDIVYGFDISGDAIPTQLNFAGFLNSKDDELNVKAYDFNTSSWKQIGLLEGSNATVNEFFTYPMFKDMVGSSGDDLGKVYVRFQNTDQTNPDLNIDLLFLSYAIVRRTTGYSDGAIWIDTSLDNENTESYVDGTADNPVSTWAAAKTISDNINLTKFYVANGSSITMDASCDNYTFIGHEYTLALGGQSFAGAYIEGAVVSGTATAGAGTIFFRNCHIGDVTVEKAHFVDCAIENTLTISDTETYILENCYASDTGGAAPPEIDFNDVAGTVGLRQYAGGIKVLNMAAGSKFTVQGVGKLTIDSSCDAGGTIGIQGNMLITDNANFSGTLEEDARIDVDQINTEVDTALRDINLDHLTKIDVNDTADM